MAWPDFYASRKLELVSRLTARAVGIRNYAVMTTCKTLRTTVPLATENRFTCLRRARAAPQAPID